MYGRKRGNINIEGIKSKPKMIVAFLLMSAILMMSIQTSMATEKDIMSNDVIKQAFDNNVNKISCIPETIETIEVHVNLQLGGTYTMTGTKTISLP